MDQFNEAWESDWITGAFWHVLNFSTTAVICLLWAPSDAASKYAFDQLPGDEWDAEGARTSPRPTCWNRQRSGWPS
jgi:hypothetical protein